MMSEDKDEKELKQDSFEFNPKINIGIDFGTDGTGMAYSFPGGNTVYVYGKWRVNNNDNGNKTTSKPRTAILLHKTGKFMSLDLF